MGGVDGAAIFMMPCFVLCAYVRTENNCFVLTQWSNRALFAAFPPGEEESIDALLAEAEGLRQCAALISSLGQKVLHVRACSLGCSARPS
jgi:hypothetical protein